MDRHATCATFQTAEVAVARESSATQRLLWYRLLLDTGNRQYLDDSVLYNEDDCRATKLIKDWMASGGAEKVGQVT